MDKEQVENRKHRIVAFATAKENGTLPETILSAMSQNEEFAQMDSIMGIAGENGMTASSVTESMVVSGTMSGASATPSDIDAMISVAKDVSKSVAQMDGINSAEGSAVVASIIGLNQFIIKNSQIGGLIGNISDMQMAEKDGNNIKFKVFSISPVITKGMGETSDEEDITPKNSSATMAHTKRFTTFIVDSDVETYEFDVKKKTGDADNYPLAHGVTSVILGDTGFTLSDENASQQEKVPVREYTINDKQVKMTVDKAGGKVTVSVPSGALEDGTLMLVETSLSLDKLSEIRGMVGEDIKDHTYVANGVTIGTEVAIMDSRQVSQQLSHGLLAGGLTISGEKIASERLGISLKLASAFRVMSGTPVDLTKNTGLATTSEAYKGLTVAIDTASVEMLEESQITDKVMVEGGKGLIDAFNMMAKNTDGMNVRDTNDANGIKFIGYLDGKYPAYYNPNFDEENPLVDAEGNINTDDESKNVYHTMNIFGTPTDPAKRIVIGGIGLPIIPIDFKISTDSKKSIALEGKTVLSVNKDPKSRKLAKKILYRIA